MADLEPLKLRFRMVGTADAESLAPLFHAVQVYYFGEAAPSAEDVTAHVRDVILAPGTSCETVVGEVNAKPVALATFAVLYPAPGVSGVLYMKELFVDESVRGEGVGDAMMRAMARLARERGCTRMDWTAETSNPGAIGFYDRFGAERVADKVYFRLDAKALASACGEDE